MGHAFPEPEASPDDLRALAERVTRGDPAAEDELVRLFRPRVLIMMRTRTQGQELADDLCQDVLIAVLRALRQGQLRETERLAAFVHGIGRNAANNYLRTRRRHPFPAGELRDVQAPRGDDPVESRERRRMMSRALAAVAGTDRSILMLTLVEGLKPGEIATRLGMNDEVVRARKSRAFRKVIERLRGLPLRHDPV